MKKINKYNLNELSINELENLLNKEMKKPAFLINSSLIENITNTICSKKGVSAATVDNNEISDMVNKIIDENRNHVKLKHRIAYRITACAMALFICLNVYTVSAYNENIFSFLVEFTKGGVLVQFNESQEEEIIIPVSPDDPYGIIAKCKENGIENIETPHYLPEGFILTEFEADNDDFSKYVHFTYKNGKQFIFLNFEEYHDGLPEKTGIPSDEHNITEIKINEHPAIMSREDNQMIVICQYDNKSNDIFAQDVPYDECDKIINSYK